jgi:hypothetical protein
MLGRVRGGLVILTLTGPGLARFELDWSTRSVGTGCAGGCPAPPRLRPVDTTLDGRAVTLLPFGYFPGDSPQPDAGASLAGWDQRDRVGGETVYVILACQPQHPVPADTAACTDIVRSISWSPPPFASLHGLTVVAPA